MSILHTLESYKNVIDDLKFQKDFYEEDIFGQTIAVLEGRVVEINTVWAKEVAEETAELEASKARHPSFRKRLERRDEDQ